MKTVSCEKAQELQDKWVKETYFLHVQWKDQGKWETVPASIVNEAEYFEDKNFPKLPAPTLDEVLEELSGDDLENYYTKVLAKKATREEWEGEYETYLYYIPTYVKWLYTTMRSADAAAEVWLKTRGKIPSPDGK